MAKQDSPESVIAAANKASAPIQYTGQIPFTAVNRSADTQTAIRRPDGYSGAADPAVSPHLANANPFILATENPGASHAITATINKPVNPVAANTMVNARLLPSAIKRSAQFASGNDGYRDFVDGGQAG
jgi:hypothetical protein